MLILHIGLCEEQEQLPSFLQKDVFIITTTSAIAMCRMHLFSRPQKQQLHHHMGKRDVDLEELAFTCLHTLATALYPSTTFATHLTLLQSAPDKKQM
jgi:hypothetical protein